MLTSSIGASARTRSVGEIGAWELHARPRPAMPITPIHLASLMSLPTIDLVGRLLLLQLLELGLGTVRTEPGHRRKRSSARTSGPPQPYLRLLCPVLAPASHVARDVLHDTPRGSVAACGGRPSRCPRLLRSLTARRQPPGLEPHWRPSSECQWSNRGGRRMSFALVLRAVPIPFRTFWGSGGSL